jgi:hypothetical protein
MTKHANLKSLCKTLCVATTLSSASVLAQPYADLQIQTPQTEQASTPTQHSINQVVSYYYGAELLPVLADYKLCADIGRIGDQRNECINELSPDSLVAGDAVYLWMNYLVPKGTQAELLLHYNHQGITRDTSNLHVKGSIRYRTWKKIKLSRSGTWELPIYHEQAGQYSELDRIILEVNNKEFAGLSSNQ